MASLDPFIAHCTELLAPLGSVRVRRMFGGHGIYLDDMFIALVADQVLYLKVDARTEPDFRAAGCRAFSYTGKGKAISLGYWSAPEAAMDAAPAMAPWARLALDAALRARSLPRPMAGAAARAAGRTARKPLRPRP